MLSNIKFIVYNYLRNNCKHGLQSALSVFSVKSYHDSI
jgi:hypothetical protein